MDKYCVYLDILGFKNKRIDEKIQLLTDMQETLDVKLSDKKHLHTVEPRLRAVLKKFLADSFNYFLTLSDSVFIVADDLPLLLNQVSNFLSSALILNSQTMWEECACDGNPHHIERDGKVVSVYPLLFRGGIAYGSVEILKVMNMVNKERTHVTNLTGEAVERAAELEQTECHKGPRLFCHKDIFERAGELQKFFQLLDAKKGLYEVLWPAFNVIEESEDKIQSELDGLFLDFFIPAYELLKFYKGKKYDYHYIGFLKLVMKSIEIWKPNEEFQDRLESYLSPFRDEGII